MRLSVTAALILVSAPIAAQPTASTTPPAAGSDPKLVCKHVVSSERGAKPYELCMTKAEWEAKRKADAKDPNRMVCRYQEAQNTRFKSYKVCMSAAEWDTQRRLERQAVERIQSGVCVPLAGC